MNKLKIEWMAAIIAGEYRYSAMRLIKETGRMYWFEKYEVKIGIPKHYLDKRLRETQTGISYADNKKSNSTREFL
jgi:hypothetical protein